MNPNSYEHRGWPGLRRGVAGRLMHRFSTGRDGRRGSRPSEAARISAGMEGPVPPGPGIQGDCGGIVHDENYQTPMVSRASRHAKLALPVGDVEGGITQDR